MIEQIILNAVVNPFSIGLLVLMAGNVILSVVAAIAKNTFEFSHLGDFVGTRLWPFIGYLITAILATMVDEMIALAAATGAAIFAVYMRGILAAIKSLTGANIPDVLTEKR